MSVDSDGDSAGILIQDFGEVYPRGVLTYFRINQSVLSSNFKLCAVNKLVDDEYFLLFGRTWQHSLIIF